MLRKLIQAGAILALLTGAAAAQLPMPSISLGGDGPAMTPEQREKQRAIDDAYKSATKKVPEKKVVNDPWGNIRPDPSATAKNKQ